MSTEWKAHRYLVSRLILPKACTFDPKTSPEALAHTNIALSANRKRWLVDRAMILSCLSHRAYGDRKSTRGMNLAGIRGLGQIDVSN